MAQPGTPLFQCYACSVSVTFRPPSSFKCDAQAAAARLSRLRRTRALVSSRRRLIAYSFGVSICSPPPIPIIPNRQAPPVSCASGNGKEKWNGYGEKMEQTGRKRCRGCFSPPIIPADSETIPPGRVIASCYLARPFSRFLYTLCLSVYHCIAICKNKISHNSYFALFYRIVTFLSCSCHQLRPRSRPDPVRRSWAAFMRRYARDNSS